MTKSSDEKIDAMTREEAVALAEKMGNPVRPHVIDLMIAAADAGARAEREACAKIAEECYLEEEPRKAGQYLAQVIRQRGAV